MFNTCRVYHALHALNFLGCRFHSLASSLALKITIALSLEQDESPSKCPSNGAKLDYIEQ